MKKSVKNSRIIKESDFSSDIEDVLTSHQKLLEKHDRQVAFALEGPKSKEVLEKHINKALSGIFKKFVLSIVSIPTGVWFSIQVTKEIISLFSK